MAVSGLTKGQALIVAHPVLVGFAWGAATVTMITLFNALIGDQPAVTPRGIALRAIAFAVLSPIWGLATRRAILRKADHAG